MPRTAQRDGAGGRRSVAKPFSDQCRAVVQKPKLLILDEATTALDPENEATVCETLCKLKGQLTILAISHQPAILGTTERAYRLVDGKAMLVTDLLTDSTSELNVSAATA